MHEFIKYANEHPWIFITFILCITIWRVLKFLGIKLFDEDKGLLPSFVKSIQRDSRETKLSIAESRNHASRMFEDNMRHTNMVEERIIKKVDDESKAVKFLLGEIINKDK